MQDNPTRRTEPLKGAILEVAPDTWLGRVIDGRYRIVERLGEGGMGAVFCAEHLTLKKRVALKVIHAHFAGNDEIAARFAREAMTSAHVEHPNVASALDFGALPEGGAYLVMQLVRGPSLSEHLLRHGALPYAEACRIAAQVADAVAAAHAAGIVHRDLKPDNVVLLPSDDGPPMVKVLDFGIAHVKAHNQAPSEAGRALTQLGVVIGTPGYMPPEQATGQTVDERADLYALGVMLWELLMGKAPFEGETFSAIVTSQLKGPAPELALFVETPIPDALRNLVRALLERSPDDRPRSAAQVRDILRSFASDGLSVTPSSPRNSFARASMTSTVFSVPLRTLQGVPVRVRALVAVVALLFACVVWGLASGSDEPEAAAQPTGLEKARPMPLPATSRLKVRRGAEPERSSPVAATPVETRGSAREQDSDSSPRETTAKSHARPSTSKRSSANSKSSDRPRPVQRLKRALDDLLQ